jgi:competence protein ComEC
MSSGRPVSGFDTGARRSAVHRPALAMALALIGGIAMGAGFPGYTIWVAGAVIVSGGVKLHNAFRDRRVSVGPLVFLTLVGYLSIQPWLIDSPPDGHISHFAGHRTWRIAGVIAEPPKLYRGRWRFVLAADTLESGRQPLKITGLVAVSGRGQWPGALRGNRVEFKGRLRRIRSFANPGGFDYERYMALQAVRVRAYARAGSLRVVSAKGGAGWRGRLDACRDQLGGRMDRVLSGWPAPTVRLLRAILLGDRGQVSPQMRQAFNRAGVSHVLAISGLHVGMVAGLSFVVVKWILSWIPLMLRHAWTRKGAALAALGAVGGYGLLAGLSPSTQRAMIMAALFLLTFWVGRRHDWINPMAVAALVILWIQPPALFSISFQLSFAAVLAILVGTAAGPVRNADRESSLYRRMLRRLWLFVRVSLMAVAGTLPLVLYYFSRVSIAGPAVNLLVVPLVGTLIVPAGLAGVAVGAINAHLAAPLWHMAAMGMNVVRIIVEWAARLPWAAIQTVTPTVFEIGLYYLLAAVLLGWKRLPRPGIVLTVLLALGLLDAGYWTYQRFGRRDLRVTVIDVGQGTANLVQFPGGTTALIDGGGFSDNAAFDVGAKIVGPLLWRLKIATVDLVVLSHANSDHLNGLLYILEHFHVKEVWSNGELSRSKGFRQWQRLIADLGLRHIDWERLPAVQVHGEARLRILAPPGDFRRPGSGHRRDLNNNSVVLHLAYQDVSFLFSGDIKAATEKDLVSRLGAGQLKSTFLVVPHHGSRYSSTTAFLRAVQPREALISAGWHNRFGFPHPDVTRRLSQAGARIWCTADHGAIEVETDGENYRIATVRRNPGDGVHSR